MIQEAKAWLKRKGAPAEIVHIVQDNSEALRCYQLYRSFEENPDCLGRILFDANDYWIYDGALLTIAEQEQLAKFIMNYLEKL